MDISGIEDIFNSEDAILLAGMSYQTYPFFEEGKLVLPKGFELRYPIRAIAGVSTPAEEVFGFIAESEDKIVIAFRGTDSSPDVESDLDFFQVPYPFVENAGKTHHGGTCIYKSTRNALISELTKLAVRKRLYITGHSLGAGLATLFALDAAVNSKFKNPIVYTLASGRVGDPAFALRFNKVIKNSIRIFNVHDPVPTFPNRVYPPPFTEEGLIYQHVNRKYPIFFQLNNMPRNHTISCYFKNLNEQNPTFTKALCNANPGFCPDTGICYPFPGPCCGQKSDISKETRYSHSLGMPGEIRNGKV